MRAKSSTSHQADTPVNGEANGHSEKMITSSQSSSISVSSPSAPVLAKRRRVVTNAAAVVDNLDLEDDAEEMRNRRIQHIVETARPFNSPVGSPVGEHRHRILVGRNGMTNLQISEHYASCLKLCAENKINSKNAFSLHLIDYMSDMLRQRDDTETNFQVAGTTLDASAKIYAYRVESVHRETLKIAGGLGCSEKESHSRDEDGDGAVETDLGEPATGTKPTKKRRKKVTKGNTIETNEKVLNMNVGDSQFAGDALFDRVRSNFDEGSSSGLFLNTLSTFNDSNRLLLHCLIDQPAQQAPAFGRLPPVSISDIEELLANVDLTRVNSVCPGLGDFGFIGWKPDAIIETDKDQDGVRKETGKYAVELPPTPPPQPDFGLPLEDEFDGDESNDGSWDYTSVREMSNEPQPQSRRVSKDAALCVVSAQRGECSYFDPNNITMMAGAGHWRVKAKLHSLKRDYMDRNGATAGPAAKERKVATRRAAPRKRKDDPRLSFDKYINENLEVPMGTGATLLSKAKLKQWQNGDCNLDEEADSDVESLHHLFIKPGLWLVGNAAAQERHPTCNVTAYGSADEDKSLFGQSPVNDGGGMDIDFGVASGGEDNDEVQPMEPCTPVVATDDACSSQAPADAFADGLIQQPQQVNKIVVPYARHAKKINVRKLKRTMWSVLTKNESTNPEDQRNSGQACVSSSPAKTISNPKVFSKLCTELPRCLPPNMAENLSVPIVFVCLLHMCNEKTLSLEGQEDMGDFTILSGTTDQEQDSV